MAEIQAIKAPNLTILEQLQQLLRLEERACVMIVSQGMTKDTCWTEFSSLFCSLKLARELSFCLKGQLIPTFHAMSSSSYYLLLLSTLLLLCSFTEHFHVEARYLFVPKRVHFTSPSASSSNLFSRHGVGSGGAIQETSDQEALFYPGLRLPQYMNKRGPEIFIPLMEAQNLVVCACMCVPSQNKYFSVDTN